MVDEKHYHGLFHHLKGDEDKAAETGGYDGGTEQPEVDYKKEEKHHKHLEHLGEVGAAAAGAYALVIIFLTSSLIEFKWLEIS